MMVKTVVLDTREFRPLAENRDTDIRAVFVNMLGPHSSTKAEINWKISFLLHSTTLKSNFILHAEKYKYGAFGTN